MSGPVVHLLVDPVSPQTLRDHVAPGEPVIDLTLEQSLVEAHPEDLAGLVVYGTTADDVAVLEETLTQYLGWLGRASTAVAGGVDVRRLLAWDEHFSLWWVLPSVVHAYHQSALPKALQKASWLLDATDGAQVRALLTGARRVQVWSASRTGARALRAAVSQIAGREVVGGDDVDVTGTPSLGTPTGREVRAAIAQLAAVPRVEIASRRDRAAHRSDPAEPPDVLLATWSSSWTQEGGGRWWNRYYADLPELLGRRLRVAWLPLVTHPREFERLERALAASPFPVVRDGAALSAGDLGRVVARAGRLAGRFLTRRKALRRCPDLRFRGLDLGGVIVEEATQAVRNAASHGWRYERARRAMATTRPKVVLLKDEYAPYGLAVTAAPRARSEVWAFQHGTIPLNHWLYQHSGQFVPERREPRLEHRPTVDRFLCYGPYEQDRLSRHGFPADRLVPLGSLRHDSLFERGRAVTEQARAAARARFGFPAERPVLLLCAQMTSDLETWIGLLVGGLRDAGLDAHIAYKPHPKEDTRSLASGLFEGLGWTDYSTHGSSLHDLLVSATALVTGTSTTVVEAAILGTPSISCRMGGHHVLLDYGEAGIALAVADRDQMRRALTAVTASSHRAQWRQARDVWLERHLANASRPAHEALVEMIEAM